MRVGDGIARARERGEQRVLDRGRRRRVGESDAGRRADTWTTRRSPVDEAHRDAERGQVEPHAVCQALDGMLARHVGEVVGARRTPGQRADIDHAAGPARSSSDALLRVSSGKNASVTRTTPSTLTSTVRRVTSTVSPPRPARVFGPMPALFTSPTNWWPFPRSLAWTLRAAAATLAGLATSSCSGHTQNPLDAVAAARSARPDSVVRTPANTVYPRLANRSAASRPMPDDAPDTMIALLPRAWVAAAKRPLSTVEESRQQQW